MKGRNPLLRLVVHNTLAISTDGIPLGLLDQKIYRRSEEDVSKTQWNKKRPIEKKESYRWIEVVKKMKVFFQNTPAKIVHICDREGEIYELLHEISKTSHQYVIRAAKDRVIGKRFLGDATRKNKNTSLWKHMELQPVSGTVAIEVSKKAKQPKRTAICEVKYSEIDCTPSYRYPEAKSGELSPIRINAIWVKEINCHPDIKPLEWMLLTNIKTGCLEEALEKIAWYKARWHIESYHKVLKSGCNVEKSKLDHADKLEKFATLMSIIAARVYQLKLTGRSHPNTPCNEILEEEEWKILYYHVHKKKALPAHPPSANEVMLWIAKLGGFLGRKSDGHPGSIVIWRGWQRLMDIIHGWKTFQLIATSG